MATTVEFKESSTLPRRWLDFMKCGSVHELPFLSSSMPSIPQDLPRDQGKGNHGVDCCKEIVTSTRSDMHAANSRPRSAVGVRDPRPSRIPIQRPSSAYPRLERGCRAPLPSNNGQLQFAPHRGSPRGIPLFPPESKLAGRPRPLLFGPPHCPSCGFHPRGSLPRGPLGPRGLPPRAFMAPHRSVERTGISPVPGVGLIPRVPRPPRGPAMEFSSRGPCFPPRYGFGMPPRGSKLPPRPVVRRTSRWSRSPPPALTREQREPTHIGPGRGPRPGGQFVMGPRRSMVGRGREPPPWSRRMVGPRGGLQRPDPEGPSPKPDTPTAAPPWMSNLRVDDDFAQPEPVSMSKSYENSEPASPTQDLLVEPAASKAEPTTSNMPPWAKPYKAKTEVSAPSGVGDGIDVQQTSSLERKMSSSPPRKDGLPDWLQPTTVIVPSITAPRAQGKEDDVDVTADHRGGGLDWLKDAASLDTKVAVTPRAAAIAHEIMDESKPAQGTDDAPGRISATDWLGAALRGETPKALIAQQGESAATKAPDVATSTDWLSQAALSSTGVHGGRGSTTKEVEKRQNSSIAPGGWMYMKLGISVDEEEEDERRVGAEVREAEMTSKKVKKKTVPGKDVNDAKGQAAQPAGWLSEVISSGKLGVAGDGSDDADGKSEKDGDGPKMVSSSTQWEDGEGKDRLRAPVSTLPPWAARWTPPSPDPPHEVAQKKPTVETEAKPEASGLDWIKNEMPCTLANTSIGASTSSGEAVATGLVNPNRESSGLDWLKDVTAPDDFSVHGTVASPKNTHEAGVARNIREANMASAPSTAGPAASGCGIDWLVDAAADEKRETKVFEGRVERRPNVMSVTATSGDWLTSGKLGVLTEKNSSDGEDAGGVCDSGHEPSTDRKPKSGVKTSSSATIPTATGLGGWLSSGTLGVPVDDQSEMSAQDEDGGTRGSFMVSEETQTEEDIEEVAKKGTGFKFPPWAKPWTPPPESDAMGDPAPPRDKVIKKQDISAAATPDWILASLGPSDNDAPTEIAASGGLDSEEKSLDWLAQAVAQASTSVGDTQGLPPTAAACNTPDWLLQAAVGGGDGGGPKLKKKLTQPSTGVAPSALSWMTKRKRRSSMDLEDPCVEALVAEAKTKDVPGGWMQSGALGAPDSVDEEQALEEARSAPSHPRPSNKVCSFDATSDRRPSLSGGVPAWTPKQLTEIGADESRESWRARRESLAGGLPPWAPTQQQEKAPVLVDAAPATSRRSSLGGGMPPWAPAPAVATEASPRQSLGGDIPPRAPESLARSVEKAGAPSTHEDTRQGECSSEKQQTQQPALPDWLTIAAGGSSPKEAFDGARDETAENHVEGITTHRDDSNAVADDREGGIDWLKAVATSDKKVAAAMIHKSVNESKSTQGVATSTDWLSQAAMSAADADGGRGGETKNVVRHRNSLVTTGGWISMKLGLPVDEEYAFNGKGGSDVRETEIVSKTAKKRSPGIAANNDKGPVTQPAGWLSTAISSGKLGVAADDVDDDDGQTGEDGRSLKMVTSSTQWEDGETEDSTRAPASTLPPWAARWTPPSPDPPPEAEEKSTVESEAKPKPSGLNWVKNEMHCISAETSKGASASGDQFIANGCGSTIGDSSGLDWLKEVSAPGGVSGHDTVASARNSHGAVLSRSVRETNVAPPTVGATAGESGIDWLVAAAASERAGARVHEGREERHPNAINAAATSGGWLTSGKLVVSTEKDSGDEAAAGGVCDSGHELSTGRKPKSGLKTSSSATIPTATGPGGWLASGTLGVPVDDESESNAQDGDGGTRGSFMVSDETQTEEGIEEVAKKGTGSKLPPWAKPWTPPPEPDVMGDPVTPRDKDNKKQDITTTATPDWILASLGQGNDDALVEIAASGGLDSEGKGLGWLIKGVDPVGSSVQDTQGLPPTAAGYNTSDWLLQAIVGGGGANGAKLKKKPNQPSTSVVPNALSWMTNIKRRSSMDLEDPCVGASVVKAKTKVGSGGWIQSGALGAPDSVDEEQALEEARAALSHPRPSNKTCSSDVTSDRRPSLSGGAPPWTPKQLTETGADESRESRRDRRESLAGGFPPWAPIQQREKAPVLIDAASATSRRSSLGGGMPPWAPAPVAATEASSRLSLGGDISPGTPKSSAESVEKAGAPSTHEGTIQGGHISEKQQTQQLALPDWLTIAAGGSSTKAAFDCATDESAEAHVEGITMHRDDSNAEGDDREGGLGWLKAVVTSDKKVAATPRAVVMVHKNADELRSAQGVATSTDWLSQAAMSIADADSGHGSETKNVVRRRNSLVTTGGWISMKLGLPVDEEHALNGKAESDVRETEMASKKVKKRSPGKVTNDDREPAAQPAGWLSAAISTGKLGVAADDSDDDDGRTGEDGRSMKMVSSSTQWEYGETEDRTRVPASTLPPWAARWTPPSPDPPPEVEETPTVESEVKPKPSGLDWIKNEMPCTPAETSKGASAGGDQVVANGCGRTIGDSSGLDWLKEVSFCGGVSMHGTIASARNSHRAALPRRGGETNVAPPTVGAAASGSGVDWLVDAAASEKTEARVREGHEERRPNAMNAAATSGGWLTSSKLGVSTGKDSGDEEGTGGVCDSGYERSTGKKPKSGVKTSSSATKPTATGPGGWLASGTLGVPVDDESERSAKDGDGGMKGSFTVSEETQTEEDIEEVAKKGTGSKLPPWAKPWTPPPEPDVTGDPVLSRDKNNKKQDIAVAVTPDWILASLGRSDDDAPAETTTSGGLDSEGNGLDWLAKAVDPASSSVQDTQGLPPTAAGPNTPDWLLQTVVSGASGVGGATLKKKPNQPSTSVAPNALSWMTKEKRRSSIDLEDPCVEALVIETKTKARSGGWMQSGALGAPDSIEEEKTLEEARATSSHPRPSNKACSSDATSDRRLSLSGGVPAWTPKQLTETGVGESKEFRRGKRESLAGGLPPRAPMQQQEKALVLVDVAPATSRRVSLGGGMPPWAPAPAAATEASSRPSFGGNISPWTSKSLAGPIRTAGAPSTHEDTRQGGCSSEKQQAQQLALPDWLTIAAGGSSTKEAFDGGRDESAEAHVEGIMTHRDDSKAVGDEREGGLGWLKAAITSDEKVAATPSTVGMVLKNVDESKSTQGAATSTDWLLQAAMSTTGADSGHDSETKNVVRRRNSLVTTGGWISMKLGLPVDEEHALNGKAESDVRETEMASKKVKKRSPGKVTNDDRELAAQPAGWLSAAISTGKLGVTVDDSDDDDGQTGEDGRSLNIVSSSIQWEDGETEDRTRAPASTLPPWAARWTPPSPDPPPKVEETPTVESEAKSKLSGLDCIKNEMPCTPAETSKGASAGGDQVVANGCDRTIGENSGLDWLKEVSSCGAVSMDDTVASARSPHGAALSRRDGETDVGSAPPTVGATARGSGIEWLVDAAASEKTEARVREGREERHPNAMTAAATSGGWLTSGKLGVSTEKDSGDEEGSGGVCGSGYELSTGRKPKSGVKKSSSATKPTATGPGGWLASETLDVPVDDESKRNAQDGDGGMRGSFMVSGETQTEEDIEEVAKKGTGSKLPPWAKPWAPPPEPNVTEDPVQPRDKDSKKQDIAVAVTPDWILASLGQSDDDAPAETAASGGLDSEGKGLDWLAKAVDPARSSVQDTQGLPPTAAGSNTPDWLLQTVVGGAGGAGGVKLKKKPNQPSTSVAPNALSWMTKIKRRSSIDLEDPCVEALVVETKTKAGPGCWMQSGALGAPDSIEEEKALEKARAASSHSRPSSKACSSDATSNRRPSLSDGAPAWTPKQLTETGTGESREFRRDKRESLAGGLPPWAPTQQQEKAPVLADAAPATRRRSSLGGGMPPWAPAPAVATEAFSRLSLDGDISPWTPKSFAGSVGKTGSPSTYYEDARQGGYSSEKQQAQQLALPDWLTTAACGSSTKEAFDGVRDESAEAHVEGIMTHRDDSDAVGDEREGGLSWLKAAITSDKKVAATPSAVAMGHKSVDESKSTQGVATPTDWLSQAAMSVADADGGHDSETKNVARRRKFLVTTRAKSDVGETEMVSKKAEKISPGIAANDDREPVTQPAGWLSAAISTGKLGVAADDSDDDDGQTGEDGRSLKMVSSNTQWEDGETEDRTRAPASTLPPWAVRWTPPSPDPPPEVDEKPTVGSEAKPKSSGLNRIQNEMPCTPAETSRGPSARGDQVVANGCGRTIGDSGGLDWLKEVSSHGGVSMHDTIASARNSYGAALSRRRGETNVGYAPPTMGTTAGGSGIDWLVDAAASEKTEARVREGREGRHPNAMTAAATRGGWLTSGKLGVSTEKDSGDEEGAGGVCDSGYGLSTGRKPKSGIKMMSSSATTPTATGPGGWLASGTLGVSVDDESERSAQDGDGGMRGFFTVSKETQTEEDIEEVANKGTVSNLLPWAKPWTAPPEPDVTGDLVLPRDKDSKKQDITDATTPDWILASLGRSDDDASAETAASGGLDSEGKGLDWLAKTADPASSSVQDTQGLPPEAAGSNTSDWLLQTVVGGGGGAGGPKLKKKPNQSSTSVAPNALSWMSKMKRRSSIDLEDPCVEALVVETKTKAGPGGWMQSGALGAPDSIEEEKALEEARAASSNPRPSNKACSSDATSDLRLSLSDGAPAWTPKQLTETGADESRESWRGKRESLAGGLPPWARTQPQEKAPVLVDAAPATSRRSSLGDGMPPWEPTPAVAAEVFSSLSLNEDIPPWTPKSLAGSVGNTRVPSTHEDTIQERCSSKKRQAQQLALPDWLTIAADRSSTKEAFDGARDESAEVHVEGIMTHRDDSNAVADDREGGLGWLKAAITSDKKVAATPSAVAMVHKSVDESTSAQGVATSTDWLSQAAMSVADADGGHGSETKNVVRRRNTLVTTGAKSDVRETEMVSKKAKKRSPGIAANDDREPATQPAGWLSAAISTGKLGVAADDSDDDDGQTGEDGRSLKMVSSSTQWEDGETEDRTRAPASTLPPWAVRRTPPSPDPPAKVEEKPTVESEAKPKPSGLDWIKNEMPCTPAETSKGASARGDQVVANGCGSTIGDSSGLDWLKGVSSRGGLSVHDTIASARNSHGAALSRRDGETNAAAAPPTVGATAGGSGINWLVNAAASEKTEARVREGREESHPSVMTAAATSGGWLTSGKLGVSTDKDSGDEAGAGGVCGSGYELSTGRKPKSGVKMSNSTIIPAATRPGGWLASGTLGVSVDDESERSAQDGDGGMRGSFMVSGETQAKEDIEEVANKGTVSKLPPWAKPWTAPPEPDVMEDPVPPRDKDSKKQDITVAATLDCILASLEQSDDGAPGETAASGGIVHENVDESKSAQGLATSTEWLSQAVSTSDAGGSRDGATNDFKKRAKDTSMLVEASVSGGSCVTNIASKSIAPCASAEEQRVATTFTSNKRSITELEDLRLGSGGENTSHVTEAGVKSSTGIQCGETITGAPMSKIDISHLAVQVDLGKETRTYPIGCCAGVALNPGTFGRSGIDEILLCKWTLGLSSRMAHLPRGAAFERPRDSGVEESKGFGSHNTSPAQPRVPPGALSPNTLVRPRRRSVEQRLTENTRRRMLRKTEASFSKARSVSR